MNLYNIALFLHVCGGMGIFVGQGGQLLSLVALRQAKSAEQVRAIARLISLSEPIALIGALLTIAAGLYMALTVWGLLTGWIVVALASIVILMPPLIRGIIEPRMRAIVTLAKQAPDGPLPPALHSHIHDPILGAGLHTMIALVLGIVFLMTIKPSLVDSVIALAVALALGLASSLPLWRASRARRA
jgi:hypothetical protein